MDARSLYQTLKSLGSRLAAGKLNGELLSGFTLQSSPQYARVWIRCSLSFGEDPPLELDSARKV